MNDNNNYTMTESTEPKSGYKNQMGKDRGRYLFLPVLGFFLDSFIDFPFYFCSITYWFSMDGCLKLVSINVENGMIVKFGIEQENMMNFNVIFGLG